MYKANKRGNNNTTNSYKSIWNPSSFEARVSDKSLKNDRAMKRTIWTETLEIEEHPQSDSSYQKEKIEGASTVDWWKRRVPSRLKIIFDRRSFFFNCDEIDEAVRIVGKWKTARK